jgi:predicted Zn-dependent peptidase
VKARVDAGLASMRQPLAAATFAAARRAFEYHLLSDLQTPGQVADNFGWYSVEGNPEYAPGAGGDAGRYFSAAEAMTPEFVASVVEKYLTKPPATVTLRPEGKPAK